MLVSSWNNIISYRHIGRRSKLNTYSDGIKVILTILKLYKNYKPMAFFGTLTFILAIVSMLLFIPILITYISSGRVPQFPTLIVSGFIMLSAIQSFFAGMILQTMTQKNRQDFEMQLHSIEMNSKRG